MIINYLKYTLNNFEGIALKDMDSVKLMNRKESKYTIRTLTLLSVLDQIHQDYYILDIDQQRIMPYETVYYDYPDFALYTSHQNGKLNRYKVRTRTYEQTGSRFLELKFKTNKKITIKKRIPAMAPFKLEEHKAFMTKYFPLSPQFLEEKIQINYNRITLVDKALKERITIDLNLRYKSESIITGCEDLSIIEIKHEGDLKSSKIENVLRERKIKPLSISKYCLGISQHYGQVKSNNMYEKIREINKTLKAGNDKLKDIIRIEKAS